MAFPLSSFRPPPSAFRVPTVWARTLEGLFFPRRCLACGADFPEETEAGWLCAGCRAEADGWTIRPPCCALCSEPFDGARAGPFECWNCRGQRFAFSGTVAARRSRGLVHEMILRFKYRGDFALRHPLADWLREALEDERLRAGPGPDALVPVPLHARRQRERGFNQAAVLAALAGPRAGLPVLAALRRGRATETQTHFTREARLRNLRGAFTLRRGVEVRGKHLLLVDDVFTTGATAHECARTLLDAGAAGVRVVAVARR